WGEPVEQPIDVLALHRGMLEQAGATVPVGHSLVEWARSSVARVIILSGRGAGGSYEPLFPFTEVSSVGSLHHEHFDKFRMSKVLCSRSLRNV
nr:hypothetical protein [Kiritimatiellia bacterium]